MATALDKTLKRELTVNREPYILTLSPTGFMLLPKGRRKGVEIAWSAIVDGEAALATALNASLQFTAESARPANVISRKVARRRSRSPR